MTRWSPPDRLLLLLPAKKPEEPPLRLSSSFVRPQHQGRSLQRLLHHRNLLQWASISGAGKSRSGSDGSSLKTPSILHSSAGPPLTGRPLSSLLKNRDHTH
jgi:hypothetical protein